MQLAQWTCLVTGWLLTGVGLVVAVVVYPAFDAVGELEWPRYHERHSQRITLVVAIPWAFEGLATAWWVLASPDWFSVLHAAAAAATVATTVFGAVPQHNEIARGRNPAALRRLAVANWWRTGAWLIAAALATASLA